MYKYTCLNAISDKGITRLDDKYTKIEEQNGADAILVRSADMLSMEFDKSLLAIARAGAGVNNIPIDKCAEQGIVVFNTPGANANGVKELVLAGLLLSSRDIVGGVNWLKTQKDNANVAKDAEKKKKDFAGCEIVGKKIGIIGLGAIGVLVANACIQIGMEVYGYDPYISVDSAWHLSKHIHHITDVNEIYRTCDYISIHVPLLDSTKKMINEAAIAQMKDGVVLLNYARDLLVDEAAVVAALETGKIKRYLSDFPNTTVLAHPHAIVTPHLGASTEESEDNCAIMAVNQIRDYLENGNIINSVNFPNCDAGKCMTPSRITILHKNVKNMISQFTNILGENDINIGNMVNKSRNDYAYTLFDLDSIIDDASIAKIAGIDGVIKVRKIK